MKNMDSATFVLFGGTGDLAKRKIYPALYNLFLEEKLPKAFSVIALGRREFSIGDFNIHIEQSLTSFSRKRIIDQNKKDEFLKFFRYVALDAAKQEDYQKLLKVIEQREEELNIPQNRMFYLSVGPQFFDIITQNIKESGLGSTKGWKRLIIEKPFGHDLKSAQELNEKLSKAFR
jgi:glucose-6-phosphate 1-dehydrogenase